MAFEIEFSKYGWQVGTSYRGLTSFEVGGFKRGFGIRTLKGVNYMYNLLNGVQL